MVNYPVYAVVVLGIPPPITRFEGVIVKGPRKEWDIDSYGDTMLPYYIFSGWIFSKINEGVGPYFYFMISENDFLPAAV